MEATRRAGDSADYLFLLNHSGTEPAVLAIEPGGTDLITGSPVPGSFTLPPLAVAVVAYRKGSR
ncbi:MAG TPA: Beta-galactosidase C-terminal domain [Streptosporangiaceae bacterium]|nr:Beta-galactosidase C-terminal domain [Streptosporangiaceae bacterium]